MVIVESDSAVDVSRWCSKWSDLAELDEEAYQVCVEALENRKLIMTACGIETV